MFPNNTFTIFLGDAKTMSLQAVHQNGCSVGPPLDLSECTEIIVPLPNVDGTFTQLKLSLSQVIITSPAILGGFTVPITALVSAGLLPGELQTINVTFTIGSETFTVPFIQALTVLQRM